MKYQIFCSIEEAKLHEKLDHTRKLLTRYSRDFSIRQKKRQ